MPPRTWGGQPACLCGVNSVVTVDEAGGARLHRAGPPSNRTFSSEVQFQRPQSEHTEQEGQSTAAADVCQLWRRKPEVPTFVEVSLIESN